MACESFWVIDNLYATLSHRSLMKSTFYLSSLRMFLHRNKEIKLLNFYSKEFSKLIVRGIAKKLTDIFNENVKIYISMNHFEIDRCGSISN